ncbi:MAG: chlorite dismutase family protein [Gemmatimonadota bacterium]|nr:chlorite dismutase family protein [Gemmatimonadota bacterium]
MEQIVYPPETIEGWYAFHQVFALDRVATRSVSALGLESMSESAASAMKDIATPKEGGWSVLAPLIGSRADVMLIHFRPALDDIANVQKRMAREGLFDLFRPIVSYLSVTEAGLYNVTADLARDVKKRDGAIRDSEYNAALAERVAQERNAPHVRKRLYPTLPESMPFVSFTMMNRKRDPGANWYTLSLEERSRMMRAHGLTTRRFAGRVTQILSGSVGLDEWEWGMTSFAKDPLDFKRLVTESRYDEANAKYADFGEQFVGKIASGDQWLAALV